MFNLMSNFSGSHQEGIGAGSVIKGKEIEGDRRR